MHSWSTLQVFRFCGSMAVTRQDCALIPMRTKRQWFILTSQAPTCRTMAEILLGTPSICPFFGRASVRYLWKSSRSLEEIPPYTAVSVWTLAIIDRSGNYLDGIQVWIGTVPARNVWFVNNYTINIETPPLNTSGYHNITLMNPDGGYATFSDVLFVTDICPEVGWYGVGLECRRCPIGAYCPGGNRLWPLPGWCASKSSCVCNNTGGTKESFLDM